MGNKLFEFKVLLCGWGETEKEAWEACRLNVDIDRLEHEDMRIIDYEDEDDDSLGFEISEEEEEGTPVCKYCGSSDVKRDAYVEWNSKTRQWDAISNVFDFAICTQCDGETTLVMKKD